MPSPALNVAVMVCDAVAVVKSESELPVSAEISILPTVWVGAVVSTTIAWFVPSDPAPVSPGSVSVAELSEASLIVPLSEDVAA